MENVTSANEATTYNLKTQFRSQALYSSQDINRSTLNLAESEKGGVTVDKILSDADKFYQWLIKDI